jgi:hypothetical protein
MLFALFFILGVLNTQHAPLGPTCMILKHNTAAGKEIFGFGQYAGQHSDGIP